MRRILLVQVLLIIFSILAFGQAANHVVISEVAPMGGSSSSYNTGEFIELYNPFTVDIVFGPNVIVASGNVPAGSNAAEWQVSVSGKTIKAYGFFLIGDGGVTPTPDIFFPGSKNLANSGIRSCIQLRDGATVIDAFAWDAGTTLAGEGTRFTPSSTSSDKKSFQRKSSPSAIANDNLGDAWDSNNNSTDFFENSSANANPQNSLSPIEVNPYNVVQANGVGSATVIPDIWKFNVPTTISMIIKPANDTIQGFKFVKPQPFTWNISSIFVIPDSISINQSGDTTKLSNFLLKGTDSIIITIPNVTALDTTDTFGFNVQSSKDVLTYSPLQGQPKTSTFGTFRPMSWVKAKDGSGVHTYIGKYVVVKGIVTVANEFGGPSYLQDATAGISVYDSSVTNNITDGDEVVLLGVVSPYNGMFELNPCSILQTVSQGNPIDTMSLSISQIKAQPQNGLEPYECRLIRVNNITNVTTTSGSPATSWTTSGSGTNYELLSGTDTLEVRIITKTNISGISTPSSKFGIVGVLGQFTTYYQIIPRSYNDIIVEGAGPRIISSAPYESNMTSTSITITWQTDAPGNSIVIRGMTSAYTDTVVDAHAVTTHKVVLNDLAPATIYHIKLGSESAAGSTYMNDYIVSTASKTSLGTMNVYFNHSVNTALASGENAQTLGITGKLLARINAATYSVDAALYSLSGTAGATIANAMIAAKSRGVKVRVIGEYDNHTTAPWTTISNNGIPVIFDNFDATNAGAGLMHNKFVVIDNRDTTSDTDDWVWTGSCNITDPGTIDDAQNVIEIQDKALANAYTIEFNEMWGSSDDTPNAANSRFGAHKIDNTPHSFIINGTPVELYFSPSDGTTSKIIKTISKATNNINFAVMTVTRSDIANVLIAKKKNSLKVRGVMDNRTDAGSVFDTLLHSGVDVFLKNGTDVAGIFHHKYAIVDGGTKVPDQYVITGSHNWSSSAENSNNENTLIINSRRIANLYLQEFAVRYAAAGGTDVLAGVRQDITALPTEYALSQNYPNPFNPSTTLKVSLPHSGLVTLKIYDVLGREVATLINDIKPAGTYTVMWNASTFSSGVYFYRVNAGDFVRVKKAILMK